MLFMEVCCETDTGFSTPTPVRRTSLTVLLGMQHTHLPTVPREESHSCGGFLIDCVRPTILALLLSMIVHTVPQAPC
jgi:hypothetical protein